MTQTSLKTINNAWKMMKMGRLDWHVKKEQNGLGQKLGLVSDNN